MSLLDQVKKIKISSKVKKNYTKEEVEVAVAWAKGEVSAGQIQKALPIKCSVQTFLLGALRTKVGNY
jgi:hypothetical protein